jgi:hypothetical protein
MAGGRALTAFYEQVGCGCFFGFGEGLVVEPSSVADASGDEADGVVGGGVAPEEGSGLVGVGVSDGVGDTDGVGDSVGVGETSGGPADALGFGLALQLADGVGFGLGLEACPCPCPWLLPADGAGPDADDEPALELPPTCWPLPAGWPLLPLLRFRGWPVLLLLLAGTTPVLTLVSASAPDPRISTKAAIAATGRSQRYGDGEPPSAAGKSQRTARESRNARSAGPIRGPEGSALAAIHAAGACRGVAILARMRSKPSPSGSTDSAAARRAWRSRSS